MRRALTSVVALLTLLVSSGCGAGPGGAPRSSTATTPSATSVPSFAWAIQGVGPGGTVVEVVTADGSERTAVAEGVPGSDQTNPDWSPDGSSLAFTVTEGGRDDLWVVGVDGTNARKVFDCTAPCDYVDDPAWSPDGASIAVCRMDGEGGVHRGSLAAVDLDTGATRTVLAFQPQDFCAGPRWAPDGRRLVLEVVHRVGTELESEVTGVVLSTVDLSTEPPTVVPLTDPALFAATADWNGSGDLIVYSGLATSDATGPELFTIAPDGSNRQRLTSVVAEGGAATEPSFDDDGSSVVFVDGVRLRSIDLATRAVSPAFATALTARHPRARPLH